MSLVNVAYNNHYTWASRELRTLEQQIAIPLFNEHPLELGLTGRTDSLITDLRSNASYVRLFERAFPALTEPIDIDNVIKAIATFVRTIIAADSPFDNLLYLDDPGAMSQSALRGMQLFFSDRLNCGACHQGQNLAGGQYSPERAQAAEDFHNTALYNVGDDNRYPETDTGLRMESGDPNDDGKFRAPSLRNIAITAPYMHDGSVASLSEVIEHYAAGGRTIDTGPNAGVGKANAKKSTLLSGFELTAEEKVDLLSFLGSLTDYSVPEDPRFAKPSDDAGEYTSLPRGDPGRHRYEVHGAVSSGENSVRVLDTGDQSCTAAVSDVLP